MTTTTTSESTDLVVLGEKQLDYVLLDCSSSMSGPLWTESIHAIDSYVRGLQSESLRTRTLLHMFYSSSIDYIHRDVDSNAWAPLIGEGLEPYGSTPLYQAVELMGQRLRTLDPKTCAITIVTDGGDTDGIITAERARQVLDWCRAKGWQVTFIGADFANSAIAGRLGCKPTEAIGVQKKLLADAARSLAKKRATHARTGAPMHWTEDEQQQFGGYLAAPKA